MGPAAAISRNANARSKIAAYSRIRKCYVWGWFADRLIVWRFAGWLVGEPAMTFEPTAKWRCFFLSLAVPGLGQAYRRHVSALIWLAAAVTLISCHAHCESGTGWPIGLALAVGWSVLCVAAAEHAKRLAEPRRRGRDVDVRTGHSTVIRHGPRGRRIVVEMRIDLEMS